MEMFFSTTPEQVISMHGGPRRHGTRRRKVAGLVSCCTLWSMTLSQRCMSHRTAPVVSLRNGHRRHDVNLKIASCSCQLTERTCRDGVPCCVSHSATHSARRCVGKGCQTIPRVVVNAYGDQVATYRKPMSRWSYWPGILQHHSRCRQQAR